ncbi:MULTISPECIES: phage baseplate protein [Acetobacter]|uniref:Dit-like phage tail protein N-terminal domain-containing protein n=1 Tax=Acetobacter lovaniensis TaxID=104100 RepID=A0A841QHV2_9PROT|nr:hypothetical protein [Acetobacter lovaniensis]MBB6457905.1 hypothetical protein [Acetobacter lovaniensis]NHN82166.1 hypothetical protein [Acetobacter lovaniensis]GBQ66210.1 hypothetical protein AA0474_1052 [Acetobacter lovaniensis NRIC 0474]
MVMQTVAQPVTANVIPGAGVPKLWSTVISDAEAVASVELDTLLQNYLIQQADKQWGIFDSKGVAVVTSGRVRAVDIRAGYMISDAPLEDGAFMSYNKVKRPSEIMVEMLCDGTAMSYGNLSAISNLLSATGIAGPSKEQKARTSFTKALDALVADLNLYHVTTPEQSYTNMNVVEYSLRRSVERGITLLWADVRLQEVRLTSSNQLTKTVKPSGEDKAFSGPVSTETATSAQAASISG